MNKRVKNTLYIEGTADLDNGNLRKAFSQLLEKELKGKMPQIIMGDGINQTVDKFMLKPLLPNERRFLLIDSDNFLTEEGRQIKIKELNASKPSKKHPLDKENSFFMIQEAEAWILSQPDVLKKFGINISSLPKKNVMEIIKPSEELSRLYKKNHKEYHKVTDFSKLFPQLDTKELKTYFVDFSRLISTLQ